MTSCDLFSGKLQSLYCGSSGHSHLWPGQTCPGHWKKHRDWLDMDTFTGQVYILMHRWNVWRNQQWQWNVDFISFGCRSLAVVQVCGLTSVNVPCGQFVVLCFCQHCVAASQIGCWTKEEKLSTPIKHWLSKSWILFLGCNGTLVIQDTYSGIGTCLICNNSVMIQQYIFLWHLQHLKWMCMIAWPWMSKLYGGIVATSSPNFRQ